MATFAEWRMQKMPPWLLGPNGRAWAEAHGAVDADVVSRAKEAVGAPWPSYGPADALPRIAADVQLERGPSETDAQFRARALAAFDAWSWAGTAIGLTTYALAPAGFPGCICVANRDWAGRYSGVAPDGSTALWARFWVIVPSTYTVRVWGGFTYGTGTWGSDAPADDVTRLKRLVDQWKPGHAKFMGAIVVFGSGTTPASVPGASPWDEGNLTFSGAACMFWRVP